MVHAKKCYMCDAAFDAQRSDKKTCGPRCRKAYSRMIERAQQEADESGIPFCGECGIYHDGSSHKCRVCGSSNIRGRRAVQDRNSVCPVVVKAGELSGDPVEVGECVYCHQQVDVVNGVCGVCFAAGVPERDGEPLDDDQAGERECQYCHTTHDVINYVCGECVRVGLKGRHSHR